tara:strand:- start:3904 stop:4224 length:321 start_codon:yes stop_codon:yes gene_type:complete
MKNRRNFLKLLFVSVLLPVLLPFLPKPKIIEPDELYTELLLHVKPDYKSTNFDGGITYIRVPDNTDWNFSKGDFTIDIHVTPADISSDTKIDFDIEAVEYKEKEEE